MDIFLRLAIVQVGLGLLPQSLGRHSPVIRVISGKLFRGITDCRGGSGQCGHRCPCSC